MDNLITELPLALWEHLGNITKPKDLFGVQWRVGKRVDWHYLFVSRKSGHSLHDTVFLSNGNVRGYTRTQVGELHVDGELFTAYELKLRSHNRDWWSRLTGDPDKDVVFIVAAYRVDRIADYDLWDVLSQHNSAVTPSTAYAIYEKLRFVPFAGFPLQMAAG